MFLSQAEISRRLVNLNDMQRLYKLYGHRLVLLDATHKICKYSLPLFFLVVQGNVNFQIAAIIVVEDESAEMILKALQQIKEWNPDVNPKYGMIDFDSGEILALEEVFPGIKIFLCDFHREQAWSRWVKLQAHGVSGIAHSFLGGSDPPPSQRNPPLSADPPFLNYYKNITPPFCAAGRQSHIVEQKVSYITFKS